MGAQDADILQEEVAQHVLSWKDSNAMPPDLIARAPFQCGHRRWNAVVWLLIRLVGPACLALRPELWRMAVMVALHKRGFEWLTSSFRLIMVKSQLGLLQENVLSARLTPTVRSSLSDF